MCIYFSLCFLFSLIVSTTSTNSNNKILERERDCYSFFLSSDANAKNKHNNKKTNEKLFSIIDFFLFGKIKIAIDYIHELEKEKDKHEQDLDSLRKEIMALKIMKS